LLSQIAKNVQILKLFISAKKALNVFNFYIPPENVGIVNNDVKHSNQGPFNAKIF